MFKIAAAPTWGGLAALAGAGVLLGTVGIAAALWTGVQATPALTVTLLRIGFAVPFLFTLAAATTPRAAWHYPRHEWRQVAGLALAMAACQSLFFYAIPLAGVTLTVVLSLCSAPLCVALVSHLCFGERLSVAGRGAVALAVAGTGLLVLAGGAHGVSDGAGYGLGLALATASGAAYSAFVLLAKQATHTSGMPRSHLLAWTFAGAFAVLLPIAAASGSLRLDLAPLAWGVAIYMGLVPTGLGYLLLQVGLQSASATLASVVLLLEPAVAAGLAWVVLGETMNGLQIGGVGLLIAGVGVLSGPRGRQT
jgi:DME family drug/metabolite transporter